MKKVIVSAVGVDKPIKIVFMPAGNSLLERASIDRQADAKAIADVFYNYLPVDTVNKLLKEIAKYKRESGEIL